MPVTKNDVFAALTKVATADGTPLTETGTLSEIVASDGKVFFSITVDAAVVQAWEPVRKAAEAAVRALPGVTSGMVALTRERSGEGRGGAPQQARPQAGPSPHAGHGRPAAHAAER